MSKKEMKRVIQNIKTDSPIESDLKEVTPKERMDKLFEQAFGDERVEMISDLNEDEIRQIAIAWSYAVDYNFLQLQDMIIRFLKLRVSKGRKGRQEYVNIASAEELRDIRILKAQHSGGILSKK